jgi:hypothetical protein
VRPPFLRSPRISGHFFPHRSFYTINDPVSAGTAPRPAARILTIPKPRFCGGPHAANLGATCGHDSGTTARQGKQLACHSPSNSRSHLTDLFGNGVNHKWQGQPRQCHITGGRLLSSDGADYLQRGRGGPPRPYRAQSYATCQACGCGFPRVRRRWLSPALAARLAHTGRGDPPRRGPVARPTLEIISAVSPGESHPQAWQVASQVAKPIGPTSARYRSDVEDIGSISSWRWPDGFCYLGYDWAPTISHIWHSGTQTAITLFRCVVTIRRFL